MQVYNEMMIRPLLYRRGRVHEASDVSCPIIRPNKLTRDNGQTQSRTRRAWKVMTLAASLLLLLLAVNHALASVADPGVTINRTAASTRAPFPAEAFEPIQNNPIPVDVPVLAAAASPSECVTTTAKDAGGAPASGDSRNAKFLDAIPIQERWGNEQIAGYVASFLVLLTFCMREIWSLRCAAIASNIAFMTYGYLALLPPVFLLHSILLPINLVRIMQIVQRTRSSFSKSENTASNGMANHRNFTYHL